MAVESATYSLGNAKGIDTRWKGDPSRAQIASNLWYDPRGGWRTCGGFRRLLLGQLNQQGAYVDPFTGLGKIWSLHRFSQHNGAREWLIFEADEGTSDPVTAKLYYLSPWLRTATPYTVMKGRDGLAINARTIVTSPWQRTQSCTWGDRIYLLNGIDTPLVFDGRMADRAGFDLRPAAPIAREISGTTATYYDSAVGDDPVPDLGIGPVPAAIGDPSYVHQRRYVVTFINSRGEESPPSEASNTVEVETGESGITMGANFHYLELPIGGSNVVARRVYCTDNMVDSAGNPVVGRGDLFYFLRTVEDNDSRGIEIFSGDSYLGAELDPTQFGLWPGGAKYAVSFKGCMFLAGMNDTEVAFSRAGFPETYPLANRVPLGDSHLGAITGMVAARNAVIVFKAQGVYLIKGDPVNGFWAETLDHAHGCLAPRAIIEIPNVGVAWISSSGISMLEGTLENEGVLTKVKPMDAPLYDEIRTWNAAALINAVAVPNPNDHEVWFAIPTIGSNDPDKVYVFHYDTGQWTTRDRFPISCAVNTSDHRAYVIFGSYNTEKPGLHVYSRGWEDKAGTDIVPVYESNPLDLGQMFLAPNVLQVDVLCIGYGDLDLTLDYKTARRTGYVRAAAGEARSAQDQQYKENQNRMVVYGAAVGDYRDANGESEVAVWGSSSWGEWRPIMLRFDTSGSQVSPIHEFAFNLSVESDGVDMQIIGINIWVRGGELAKTKLLSTLLGPSAR